MKVFNYFLSFFLFLFNELQTISQGYIESGLTIMKPGNATVDWVHVYNLVQAHLLVIPGLSSTTGYIAVSTVRKIKKRNWQASLHL